MVVAQIEEDAVHVPECAERGGERVVIGADELRGGSIAAIEEGEVTDDGIRAKRRLLRRVQAIAEADRAAVVGTVLSLGQIGAPPARVVDRVVIVAIALACAVLPANTHFTPLLAGRVREGPRRRVALGWQTSFDAPVRQRFGNHLCHAFRMAPRREPRQLLDRAPRHRELVDRLEDVARLDLPRQRRSAHSLHVEARRRRRHVGGELEPSVEARRMVAEPW